MSLLDKQLLMVRKLRESLSEETRAYFYLSPVLNSKVMIRKDNTCVLNPKEKQQRG
jgi:hypothetical protein